MNADQASAAIGRARAYLADIRAGHVSFADESAPFMTLSGHLAALLGVIDVQRKALTPGYESVLGQAVRDAIKWCALQGLAEQGAFYRSVARELGIEVDQ